MQECSQTQGNDLLAPLIEAVCIAPGNREHIQRTNRHLRQKNAAALDIGEEDFDNANGKGNHSQQEQQRRRADITNCKHGGKRRKALPGNAAVDAADQRSGQICGKHTLQGNAELIQLDWHDGDQGAGEEALENVETAAFDVSPAVLIFDCDVEDRHDGTDCKERPAQQRKKFYEGLNPGQIEDLSAEVADHRKEVCNRIVDDAVDPLQQGVKDPIRDRFCSAGEQTADGVTDAADQIP